MFIFAAHDTVQRKVFRIYRLVGLEYWEVTPWSQYLDVTTMKASYKNGWLTCSATSSGIHSLTYWCIPRNHSNFNTREHTINQKVPLQMWSALQGQNTVRALMGQAVRNHNDLKTRLSPPSGIYSCMWPTSQHLNLFFSWRPIEVVSSMLQKI